MTSATLRAPRPTTAVRRVQSRVTLAVATAVLFLLTLVVMAQAWNAYGRTFALFRSIAEDSSAKVGAAEQALQAVANIDTNAAEFVATAPDNQIHWQNLDAIHANFQTFREQMFTVRATLDTDAERQIYDQIDYFAFDQFWQHIGNLLTSQQNGDNATAIKEYIIADNYLQNQIARYLLQLEALNFQAMQDTEQSATAAINSQAVLLGGLVIVLALGLTVLSFWLRSKVRRVLTPGIDAAMVLGWLLAIVMLLELAQAPGQLRKMVEDAYYSVSASSRVLAIANESNSVQSGSVINPAQATYWQQSFDTDKNSVELRLCGQPGCLANSFTNGDDTINSTVLNGASQITADNQTAINGIKPLVAKVGFAGEAATLDQARSAFNDYLGINSKIRDLLAAKNSDDASRLATGTNAGQSGEAFARFTKAMQQERQINLDIFNTIWNNEKAALPLHQVLFGLGGFVLLAVLLIVGAVHRFREL